MLKKSSIRKVVCFLFCAIAILQARAQTQVQLAQYPSPMQEHVRRHERVSYKMDSSNTITLNHVLAKPVTIYLPHNIRKAKQADLLIHFHGAASVVAYAAARAKRPLIAVAVNLGSGSSAYAQPFNNTAVFEKLKQAVLDTIVKQLGRSLPSGKIILSGFSAGYGAIRSILSHPGHIKSIHAVVLLDGLHTSYIPERKLLAERRFD
ncbi:hypothetical protein [Niabella hibiscisoli]|uniref:hypothetical protein n=1 Tax=Niabella hibiscisoli TaxID=1825928 RepID=UPI001F0F1DCF|nr:hypothetical protein [Niabella hibiscisoli]MCH5715434.1 hypothetical protein [Niabella hibiscisoli]